MLELTSCIQSFCFYLLLFHCSAWIAHCSAKCCCHSRLISILVFESDFNARCYCSGSFSGYQMAVMYPIFQCFQKNSGSKLYCSTTSINLLFMKTTPCRKRLEKSKCRASVTPRGARHKRVPFKLLQMSAESNHLIVVEKWLCHCLQVLVLASHF